MAVLESERYNRQHLIEGWDQEKLSKARVAIIGSSNLANYTLASLAALGVGNLEIYDASKVSPERDGEFLLFKAKPGDSKAQALEGILKEINPSIKIKGLSMNLERSPMIAIMGSPSLIMDLTNSPESKETAMQYAFSRGIPIISASSDRVSAEIYLADKDLREKATLPHYKGVPQSSLTSSVAAGFIAEETRKLLMPISKDEKPAKNLVYSLASETRFSKERADLTQEDLKNKKVLVIGAGALGNFVGLGLTLAGVGNIDLMDFDEVDGTNLNRQILFYDAVGKKKAEALASRLREIKPGVNIRSLTERLDQNTKYFEQNRPDLILDCVDSFAVRAFTNYFGLRNKIPIVSGGTNPKSGQVVVYVPEKTSCLDCKLGVERALGKALTSSSCRYAPDPSVIMTNQIIGGMMVGEAVKVLNPGYGAPVSRILKYDSTVPVRGGLVGTSDPCACEKPDAKQWLSDVITKYGVKEEK